MPNLCLFLAFFLLLVGCGGGVETVVVFHAGSLAEPMRYVEAEFERRNPNIDVLREASGSRVAAKKISELNRRCDVIAVSDYRVIENILMPEYCEWLIRFATNSIVLAYTDKSRYSSEVNLRNWYKILLQEGVEWGHSNPDADPCGYRALLVLKLAEIYYKVPLLYERLLSARDRRNIREKEVELVPLLLNGDMDYALIYRSVAEQHGLKFIELPPEIDLSSVEHKDSYLKASIRLSDGTVRVGEPIVYGVAIPKNAPNREGAVRFLSFLLKNSSPIFKRLGQPFLCTLSVVGEERRLPSVLRSLIKADR